MDSAIGYLWVIGIAGAVWWVYAYKYGKQPSTRITALVSAFAGLMFGVLAASWFSNPPVLMSFWGHTNALPGHTSYCRVIAATERLEKYAKDYDLVLACGPTDPEADYLRDERVHFSTPRSITGQKVPIVTALSDEQAEQFRRYKQWWFQLVLVPRHADQSKYATLEEAQIIVDGMLIGLRPGAE